MRSDLARASLMFWRADFWRHRVQRVLGLGWSPRRVHFSQRLFDSLVVMFAPFGLSLRSETNLPRGKKVVKWQECRRAKVTD